MASEFFRQSKQKFARIVDPMRRVFVTNDGKSAANSSDVEFLEAAPNPFKEIKMNINIIFDGLSLGAIYALIALGYTMVYGIAKMLNFAHGDIIMVGA